MSISSISIRYSKIFCWWNCLVHLSEPGTLVTARPKRAVPAWERRHFQFLKYRGVSWSLFPDFKVTISQHTQQHASSRLKAFRSASSKLCWTVWMVKSCQIDLTHQALLLATTQQLHLRQLQLAWVRESSKSHRLLKMPPEIVPTCHLCIYVCHFCAFIAAKMKESHLGLPLGLLGLCEPLLLTQIWPAPDTKAMKHWGK